MYLYEYMRICVCVEVNNGKESGSTEKIEKRSNSKVMNLLRRKVNAKKLIKVF